MILKILQLSSNQIQSTENNTQINNTTNVKEEMVGTPEQAVKHADQMKYKLNEKGLHVKINNTHGSIDVLKLNDIVQLIESHGYIKYWIFKGINNNTTDNKVVSLYNGKSDVNISLRLFKRSFTGIVMNLDGDYKVKMFTTWWGKHVKMYTPIKDNNILKDTQSEKNLLGLTNTETDKLTEYDVIDEIYQIQKKDLEDSINRFWEEKGNCWTTQRYWNRFNHFRPNYWGYRSCFRCHIRSNDHKICSSCNGHYWSNSHGISIM